MKRAIGPAPGASNAVSKLLIRGFCRFNGICFFIDFHNLLYQNDTYFAIQALGNRLHRA